MNYPQYTFSVIGGDRRQVYLAEELAHHRNEVRCYALESIPRARMCSDASIVRQSDSAQEACVGSDCVIGPLPLCKNDRELNHTLPGRRILTEELSDALPPGSFFFAGCIPEKFRRAAEEKQVVVCDFMQDQSLAIRNSIAAAEGAVCEAIIRSPLNLNGSRCAVLGFGKCGQTLASYLCGMFCHVYVCTDTPEELARAAVTAQDTGSLYDFAKCVGKFDFIFNTIPAPVISSGLLRNMKPSVTIIDIASAPGGVDYEAAGRMGINAAHCLSLPGKYAPASSAKILRDVIERTLSTCS